MRAPCASLCANRTCALPALLAGWRFGPAAVCCAEVDGLKRKLMNKLAPEAAALKTDWEVPPLPSLQPPVLRASAPSCPFFSPASHFPVLLFQDSRSSSLSAQE